MGNRESLERFVLNRICTELKLVRGEYTHKDQFYVPLPSLVAYLCDLEFDEVTQRRQQAEEIKIALRK